MALSPAVAVVWELTFVVPVFVVLATAVVVVVVVVAVAVVVA